MIALLLGCGGDEQASAPPPVTWSECEPLSYTLSQAWDQDSLPVRTTASKSWPGVAIGEFNSDGFVDVMMAYGGGSSLFLGDGTGLMTLWEEATVDGEPLPRGRGIAAADIDSDGDLDVFLAQYGEGMEQLLLINDGSGHFTEQTLEGSTYIPWGASFADLNGDGRLDLYIATYNVEHNSKAIMYEGQEGAGHGVYLQQADGVFSRSEGAVPASVDNAVSLQGAIVDADLDGDLDVYMVNDFGPFVQPNQLLVNDGTGRFTVSEGCDCDLSMYSMGAARGDPDGDGDPDLYISNISSPKYLMNLGDGSFADATLASGANIDPTPLNMTSWGSAFLDADQDGCMDILTVFGGLSGDGEILLDYESGGKWVEEEDQADVLLLGDCEGGFVRADAAVFEDVSRARVLAIGDLNGDLRPDVVTAGKHFIHFWLAEGGCEPGLRVSLDAGPGNHQGIGAAVAVDLGDHVVTQWMLPDTTASSSEHALYFGFGGRSYADRVSVTWPDGSIEHHDIVEAGTSLHRVR